MKQHVHLTSKVKAFIFNKMCQGYTVWALCKKWPDRVPLARTIYKKAAERPELAAMLSQGYTVVLYRKIDQLHQLARQIHSSSYQDWRQHEALLKRQIDEMKWLLACMGQKLSARFSKAASGTNSTTKQCNIQVKPPISPHIISIEYTKSDL